MPADFRLVVSGFEWPKSDPFLTIGDELALSEEQVAFQSEIIKGVFVNWGLHANRSRGRRGSVGRCTTSSEQPPGPAPAGHFS